MSLGISEKTKENDNIEQMKPKFILITSIQDECEIEIQKDKFCPPGYVYLATDISRPVLEHIKSLNKAEKEKNDWIRKYENVLQGLNYWKEKALQR